MEFTCRAQDVGSESGETCPKDLGEERVRSRGRGEHASSINYTTSRKDRMRCTCIIPMNAVIRYEDIIIYYVYEYERPIGIALREAL